MPTFLNKFQGCNFRLGGCIVILHFLFTAETKDDLDFKILLLVIFRILMSQLYTFVK